MDEAVWTRATWTGDATGLNAPWARATWTCAACSERPAARCRAHPLHLEPLHLEPQHLVPQHVVERRMVTSDERATWGGR